MNGRPLLYTKHNNSGKGGLRMSNPRSPDADKRSVERKEAERIYLEAKGDIKLVDIAKKLGLPDNKVRKWKSLDDWEGKLHPQQYSKGKKKTSGAFHFKKERAFLNR